MSRSQSKETPIQERVAAVNPCAVQLNTGDRFFPNHALGSGLRIVAHLPHWQLVLPYALQKNDSGRDHSYLRRRVLCSHLQYGLNLSYGAQEPAIEIRSPEPGVCTNNQEEVADRY